MLSAFQVPKTNLAGVSAGQTPSRDDSLLGGAVSRIGSFSAVFLVAGAAGEEERTEN